MLVETYSLHDVEEILKFKNFKGFKRQVARETAN
jgi:hypothetical protein